MNDLPSTDVEIKQKVRERYGAIAQQGAACCAPTGKAGVTSNSLTDIKFVDYSPLGDQVVEGSDLGLGCGAPTLTANLRPGETVVDLGSGAGIDAFLAARAVGAEGRVIGVDMTPEMVARAGERTEGRGRQHRVSPGRA